MIRYSYRIAVAGPNERKRNDWVLGWDFPRYHIHDRVTAQKIAKKLNKYQFASFGDLSCKYKAIKIRQISDRDFSRVQVKKLINKKGK